VITCQRFRQQLYEFLAGELSSRRREQSESHLYDCSACAAEFSSYRMTVELVRGLATFPVPDTLLRRLRRACAGRGHEGIHGKED
jgi:anti-sigma factor RsiW